MQYRPHIDGLRTVAIVPVVLFHMDIALFSGGFTGVDVFFVISGFLITSLIVEEIDTGRFSLWVFYKRRVLRILPAFLVMILAVLAASWFLLFPDETRGLGRSAVAAALFVANIHFWHSSGYFEPDVKGAPLLHTWTLSVEEQYYIFLPLFLLLVSGILRRRYLLAIVTVSLASFLLSLWGVSKFQTAAFYLLPTRAWEFGLGSLAAVIHHRIPRSARIRGPGSLVGAGLILWGVFALNEKSPFPGANAIYPSLGAMVLIMLAEETAVGRLLSTRVFVTIGKISYSLYLWHWPLIIFWKVQVRPVPTTPDMVILAGLSLVAAALSFKFVEQPFRSPAMRQRRARQVILAGAGSMAVTAAVGLLLITTAESWGRIPPHLRAIADYADYRSNMTVHPCTIHAGTPGGVTAFDPDVCLLPEQGRPTLLLLGDSHAEHLAPAFEEVFSDFNVQSAGGTGCPPTTDVMGSWHCPTIIRHVFDEHVPQGTVDTVVLSARWKPDDIGRLQKTVGFLQHHVKHVVILGPTPEFQDSFPILLARSMRYDRGDEMERYLDSEVRDLDRNMAAVDWGGARYISLYNLICRDSCRLFTEDSIPYFADYGHYTRAAALEIATDLVRMGAAGRR